MTARAALKVRNPGEAPAGERLLLWSRMKIQFQRTASPVAIEIRTASAKPLKPGPFYFGLFLAAAALLSPGWGVQRGAAQLFPNAAGDEPSYSIGVFQLTVDPAFA